MKNNKTRINLFLVVAFIMVVIGAGAFKNISVRAQEETNFGGKSSVMETNGGDIVVLATSKSTTGGVVDGDLGDENTTGSAVNMVLANVPDNELVFVGTELKLSTNTTGAAIIFTVDGSNPTVDNGKSYDKPIVIEDDLNIKAIAIKDGEYSEILELNYRVYKAEEVTATVESGVVDIGTLVSFETKTTGAAIYYTIQDLDFKEDSTTTGQVIKFDEPIEIKSNVKIKAYASKDGYKNSEPIEFNYKVEEEILIQKDFEEVVNIGEFVSFDLKAKNFKAEDQEVCIVLAAYDDKERMIDYVMVSTILTPETTVNTECGFKVPAEAVNIRGFVVDGYDSLEPISNIIDIQVADE